MSIRAGMAGVGVCQLHLHLCTVLIVTLGKSETYKETIKEKSTILPYSIHKRIHSMYSTICTVLIVTLGKSETYKETIKEKSTIYVQYSYS